MPKHNLCIVIPCYNEAKYFRQKEYSDFLFSQENVLLCFVNDGSKDTTLQELNALKTIFPTKVEIVSYEKNQGKAHAVREGMLYCQRSRDFDLIAYLDADLAVSLEECQSLIKELNGEIVFCFGSRMLKIGSEIKRKTRRFLIGRFIATIISELLSLKVYDTQCGCKLFIREVSVKLFDKPFISTWLFDVEIFCRMMEIYSREKAVSKMLEQPLKRWIDRGDSKVSLTYFFKMWIELYKIRSTYKEVLTKK